VPVPIAAHATPTSTPTTIVPDTVPSPMASPTTTVPNLLSQLLAPPTTRKQ
jgi:hypothetical protein